MRWVRRTVDEHAAALLARELGLHPVAGRILAGRGFVEPVAAERFLASSLSDLPDPFVMKGMERAVDRLVRAIRQKERVVVYGDYDVDGVTSTSLLVSFLRAVGADVGYYVPKRLVEGYGLNPAAVDAIAADGARLIVTVDCGVSAVEEIDRATRAGVDVVVVDHHRAPAELPRAAAMLNPHQPGCPFPHKELSAVGVTFHLLMALRKRLRDEGFFEGGRVEPNLKAYLDLAALGTIADVVPLVGANRILVRYGLRELERSQRPGIRALKEVAGIDGPVTAGQVGFKLGPRINAAGRLDDAATAVDLLLATDIEEARVLARRLDQANLERQQIQQAITQEALAQAERRFEKVRGLVLHAEGWHPGVVGIVASRVVERYHRPAVVLGVDGDTVKGSCRSIEAFDMYAGLGECARFLTKFGGHHHAAGVHLEKSMLPGFIDAFEAETRRQLKPDDLVPVVKVDADVEPSDATLHLAESLARLAPFGAGHPEPVLTTRLSGVDGRVVIAKNGGPDHLKFRVGAADGIGFGLGEQKPLLRGNIRIAFQLGVDTWNGRQKASARIKAIEAVR